MWGEFVPVGEPVMRTAKWGVRVRRLAGEFVVEQLVHHRRNRGKVVSRHRSELEAERAAREHVRYLIRNPPPPPPKKVRFVMQRLF